MSEQRLSQRPPTRCFLCDRTAAAGTWRVKHGATRWCCRECAALDARCATQPEADLLVGAPS